MDAPRKCIIDNWSLEHAGSLLDDSNDISHKSNDSIIKNLGGLSNFINALLLYKDSHYIINGFEKDWKRFEWFGKNASAFITGIELDELTINWNGPSAYENKGIHNYLFTSRYFESDLLVCPERSDEKILRDLTIDSSFAETLRLIDKKIAHEIDTLNFSNARIGVSKNFQFPSLLQYILSQASGRHDLLTVIMQLKSDRKIEKIIKEIEEITTTVAGAGKFQDDIERLVKKSFGKQTTGDNSWSISVSAFFVSISKTIDLNFFRRQEHMVFLKNLIACRTEAFKLEKDFARIFKKKLKY